MTTDPDRHRHSDSWMESELELSEDRSAEDPGSPLWMLWLAGTAVLASVVLFFVDGGVTMNVLGYGLGSIVAFTMVALFSRAARKRMFAAAVGTAPAVDTACVVLLAAGLLSVAVHAYLIARHYS